jgi:hypothetical protein
MLGTPTAALAVPVATVLIKAALQTSGAATRLILAFRFCTEESLLGYGRVLAQGIVRI